MISLAVFSQCYITFQVVLELSGFGKFEEFTRRRKSRINNNFHVWKKERVTLSDYDYRVDRNSI